MLISGVGDSVMFADWPTLYVNQTRTFHIQTSRKAEEIGGGRSRYRIRLCTQFPANREKNRKFRSFRRRCASVRPKRPTSSHKKFKHFPLRKPSAIICRAHAAALD